jgi:hypothetical protein
MFLVRADPLRGQQVGGGWALEISTFLGPKNGTRLSARCHFTGPKKVFISRAQPPPISTFITCENCFYIFFPALFKRKLNINFLLVSLKTFTFFKNCSKSHIKFLFRLSFTLIGRFSPVYIHGTKTIFRITGGFRNNF